MAGSRLIGIGVAEYDGHPELPRAVTDVEAVADLLADQGDFTSTVLRNPTEDEARTAIRKLRRSMPDGGSLVLLWSGHGALSPSSGLHLLARDSEDYFDDGLLAGENVAVPCAQSGAGQILLVFDTCYSGDAISAGDAAARVLEKAVPESEHIWVGVLTSSRSSEKARDGLFAELLLKLLRFGPDSPVLRVLWSRQSEYIRGFDLGDAVLKEWQGTAHLPDFSARGSAWWMFRNPLHRRDASQQVVEHLLRAARGGAAPDEQSWFTGRRAEVDQVVAWVQAAEPGLYVVTGSAGTGKTAIAGRVVSLSNPEERARLLAEGRPLGHADPGEGSVAAHVHARGLTADRAAESLGQDLVRSGLLARQDARRNAAELVGQVQRAVEDGAPPPVIVVDGLDEARGQSFTIAEDLLVRLAEHAVVIVFTRELHRGESEPSLVDVLTADGELLDLDDPAVQLRGRADLREYIARRLDRVDKQMSPGEVAAHLAESVSMTGSGPFLLARLVTDQLRAAPVDTTQPGWEGLVSLSIEDAFDTDLRQVAAPEVQTKAASQPVGSARTLLAALTWGLGAGFPEEEWITCANALAPETTFGREDLIWVLDKLGRYIIQDGEAGVAVYRVAHQQLADHIHPPFAPAHNRPFDPEAVPVTTALLAHYRELLANGVPADDPGYLWRYAWRHAAAMGPSGLEQLRSLAEAEPALKPDVAFAAEEVTDRLDHWGRHLEALAPAEEAVERYRDLAATNRAFLPGFAGAVNNLGIRYSKVGRPHDALAPTEEAVRLRRDLAAANPAYLPDLASSLNNLGVRYSEVGRRHDALAPTEEAVTLYRDQAAANRAYLPGLATALTNLGIRYRGVGRRHDALAPTEEAVRLRRDLAAANPAYLPDLAGALSNLGTLYSEVGRHHDALPPADEAVTLYRDQAAANPAYLPGLAAALNNLGIRYRGVGRRHNALAPTEEAVRLRRDLAAANPAYLPDLAGALSNLGTLYSEVGRHHDALPPADEAVTLYRDQAAANPAYLPDLAAALDNLGISYSRVGRHHDALPPADEAVTLYRDLAAANPAYLPDLAMALNNLGNRYSAVGRPHDALPATEEAVRLRRELAAANPAYLPGLANALNNLGNRYSQVGLLHDALAPTEEAVTLYRDQAAANPAYLPNLAMALNNLGVWYREAGRRHDALAAAEEAARLYRDLAPSNPAYLPNLASALYNLGISYSEAGRRHDALAPAEEAVRLRRGLAAANPAYLPELASALNSLGARYEEAGAPERAEAAWREVSERAEPQEAAFLLLSRASRAEAGCPDSAGWLAEALTLSNGDRDLLSAVHEEARRHRAADPARFDSYWAERTHASAPPWLTVDPSLLATAQAWVAAATFAAERDHLAAHPELLEPAADVAVEEALLAVEEETADRYRALRQAAQQDGVEATYGPLLQIILAREFANAEPAGQRAMLAGRREELLSNAFAATLAHLASQKGPQAVAAQRAGLLITLARLGNTDAVFDALADPSRFSGLLHATATRPDPTSLMPVALVAFRAADSAASNATALFYVAAGMAIAGDQDQAMPMIKQARALDPAQVPAWINEAAEIGRQHQGALALIPLLTAPAEDPADPEHPAATVTQGSDDDVK